MVVIQNCINDNSIDERALADILQTVLLRFDKGESEIVVRLVDKAEIQHLNKTYRAQDKPTNVLSFAADLPAEIDTPILGDVAICVEVVALESKAQNKNFAQHLTHIAVHGTLHLLGYAHSQPKDAAKMEALEIEILAKIQINNPYL